MDGLTIKQLQTRHVGPISLQLSHGECVVIGGPSGAGKTLLLRAVADLDAHDGEVLLDGVASSEMRAHEWRQRVGMLPAESQWWHESIGNHFRKVDEELLDALGFEPGVMNWEVSRCSTGERQRLALLRLLQQQPKVLLLDEPTASLDAANISRVERVVETLRVEQGLCVLWVSHDVAQATRMATRKLNLNAGQLQEVE